MAMLLLGTFSRAERCPKSGERPGYWSKFAVAVCGHGTTNQMHLQMRSPDGTKLLFAKGEGFEGTFYLKSGDQGTPQELFGAREGDEVLWSPDSKAVALTTCFGANGPCRADTTLDDDTFSPFEIVQKTFTAGHEDDECYTGANVGALTWEDGSDKIVLIAQVPNLNCDGHNPGYFEAFVVSFSERKVISRYNMQETTHRWHGVFGKGMRDDIAYVRENAKGARKGLTAAIGRIAV